MASARTGIPSLMESWAITGAMTGSSIASVMFMWTMFRRFVPPQLEKYLQIYIKKLMAYFYPYAHYSIHEFTTEGAHNNVFPEVEAYLSKSNSKKSKRVKVERGKNSKKLIFKMDDSEKVYDYYQGIELKWVLYKINTSNAQYRPGRPAEERWYMLTCNKKYREIVAESYMEYVTKIGKEISLGNTHKKLYTNSNRFTSSKLWSHIVFEHPATFQTMAMDLDKKQDIIDDLLAFANNKDFYGKIGKAWKRGYLLYGPPGTGKSTMIAAMANLLNYDIYDLELTQVQSNSMLRSLLIETTSRSIIVIEDIDCSLDLTGQRKKKPAESKGDDKSKDNKDDELKYYHPAELNSSRVTLSGLLNFVDGLWSACGAERIIVFTTNYVDKLDPALIRRGRMDKHIELSYCSFEGFKVLAKNYLGLETHPLFDRIEKLISETKITPADVAENLMPTSTKENAEKYLSNVIKALEEAKIAETLNLAKEAEKIIE